MCEIEDNNTHRVNNFDKHPNRYKRKSIDRERKNISMSLKVSIFQYLRRISCRMFSVKEFRIVLLLEEVRRVVGNYEDLMKKSQLLMMRLLKITLTLISHRFNDCLYSPIIQRNAHFLLLIKTL